MTKFIQTTQLRNLPPIDDLTYVLFEPEQNNTHDEAYVVGIDDRGEKKVLAYIDGNAGTAFCCDHFAENTADVLRASNTEPLVKLVGDIDGVTGQVVIKQPEGHWRRYSRWDRLPKGPITQPDAIVRTLPQCGCGGYLGAPMMFDSFQEMLAYFFVVFSDAESVNARHAAILTGETCCTL